MCKTKTMRNDTVSCLIRMFLSPFLEETHPLAPAVGAPEVATTWRVVTAVVWPMVTVSSSPYAGSSENIDQRGTSERTLEVSTFRLIITENLKMWKFCSILILAAFIFMIFCVCLFLFLFDEFVCFFKLFLPLFISAHTKF